VRETPKAWKDAVAEWEAACAAFEAAYTAVAWPDPNPRILDRLHSARVGVRTAQRKMEDVCQRYFGW
jgi:hypothetical protein